MFKVFGLLDSFFFVWSIIWLVVSFFVLFVLFSFLYIFVLDWKLKRREVILGVLFVIVGWIVVFYLFVYYVDKFVNYVNIYGGFGGIIILMLWFYLIGWVILFGGEINGLFYYYRIGDNNFCNE